MTAAFIELHDQHGYPVVLNVGAIEQLFTEIKAGSQRRAVVRMINGGYVHPQETYDQVHEQLYSAVRDTVQDSVP